MQLNINVQMVQHCGLILMRWPMLRPHPPSTGSPVRTQRPPRGASAVGGHWPLPEPRRPCDLVAKAEPPGGPSGQSPAPMGRHPRPPSHTPVLLECSSSKGRSIIPLRHLKWTPTQLCKTRPLPPESYFVLETVKRTVDLPAGGGSCHESAEATHLL